MGASACQAELVAPRKPAQVLNAVAHPAASDQRLELQLMITMSEPALGGFSSQTLPCSCQRCPVRCRPAVRRRCRAMAAQHADSLDRGSCKPARRCQQQIAGHQPQQETAAARVPRRAALAAMAAAPLAALQHPQVRSDRTAEMCRRKLRSRTGCEGAKRRMIQRCRQRLRADVAASLPPSTGSDHMSATAALCCRQLVRQC